MTTSSHLKKNAAATSPHENDSLAKSTSSSQKEVGESLEGEAVNVGKEEVAENVEEPLAEEANEILTDMEISEGENVENTNQPANFDKQKPPQKDAFKMLGEGAVAVKKKVLVFYRGLSFAEPRSSNW